ncbi:MAG: hypothetical protein ABIS21_05395 [Acidimicrobiales bacterium]
MLRVGVKTGLLMAILFAVLKVVQSRRSGTEEEWEPAGPDSWPPVQDPVTVEPPAPVVVSRTTPPMDLTASAPTRRTAKKAPPVKKAAAPPTTGHITWVEPAGRICPPSHPVKAKLSSRIFHLPGMAAYNRTTPDRCYGDEGAAVEDGFVKSKR